MKNTFLIVGLSILLSYCTKRNENKTLDIKEEVISGLYIYDSLSEDGKPSDSLLLYESNFEKSLNLYLNTDSMSKTVSGLVHMSIFKHYNEKFALIVDSSNTTFYQFKNNQYIQILKTPIGIGASTITKSIIDINSDGYKDLLYDIPSGGSYGSDNICLFFNPTTKTFEYDNNVELRNIELDLNKKAATCYYLNTLTRKYSINKYSFQIIEDKTNLLFTTGKEKFENKFEIKKYGENNKVISLDTIEEKQ